MSYFDDALGRIEHNRHNSHNCIPFGKDLERFSEYIPGIQKKRYYIVSGSSGAGKSQVTDHLFIFTPFNFIDSGVSSLDLKVIYFSLELDKETKVTQWMSRRLFDVYGIRTSVNILQSIGKNRLNDNLWMALVETREYFERLLDKVEIIDSISDVDKITKHVIDYSKKNGEYKYEKKTIEGEELSVFDKYIPTNKDKYVEIVLDHYSLLNQSPGRTIKGTIEDLSLFFVSVRNKLGYIPIAIQQQSAETENVQHYEAGKLEPSKAGLAESKLTYNDCDIALGIFSPYKHSIKKYRGYDILQLGDSYRNLSVFKNRFGPPNVNVGMYFDGAVNYFSELPKSEEMNSEIYMKISKRNWK